jgi:hypothetical protein
MANTVLLSVRVIRCAGVGRSPRLFSAIVTQLVTHLNMRVRLLRILGLTLNCQVSLELIILQDLWQRTAVSEQFINPTAQNVGPARITYERCALCAFRKRNRMCSSLRVYRSQPTLRSAQTALVESAAGNDHGGGPD